MTGIIDYLIPDWVPRHSQEYDDKKALVTSLLFGSFIYILYFVVLDRDIWLFSDYDILIALILVLPPVLYRYTGNIVLSKSIFELVIVVHIVFNVITHNVIGINDLLLSLLTVRVSFLLMPVKGALITFVVHASLWTLLLTIFRESQMSFAMANVETVIRFFLLILSSAVMTIRYDKLFNAQMIELKDGIKENEATLSTLTHDLNSPLNRMKGFYELMRLEGQLNNVQKNYLEKGKKVIAEGQEFIEDLMSAARGTSPKEQNITSINVNELVRRKIAEYADKAYEKGMTLNFSGPDKPLFCFCSCKYLNRILDHLIENALAYCGEETTINVSLEANRGRLAVTVADNGPGLTPDAEKYAKQLFSDKVAPNQVGIGFIVVNSMVDQLGGEVHLDTVVGGGTSVRIELPKYPWNNWKKK